MGIVRQTKFAPAKILKAKGIGCIATFGPVEQVFSQAEKKSSTS